MFSTKFKKDGYYDFVVTKDCRPYVRNPNDYLLFGIDVTTSLQSITGATLTGTTVLKNISLTGYDNYFLSHGNGTIDPTVKYTGHTGDPFTLYPVSGYTRNLKYGIVTGTSYNELRGGFYQGFFKLFNYPVEFFPNRMRKGWTVNMIVHAPTGVTTGATLNSTFHNDGFVFYLGTRAENKFPELTPIDVAFLDAHYSVNLTGSTVNNLYTEGDMFSLNNEPYIGYYNITSGVTYSGRTYSPGTGGTGELRYLERYKNIIDNAFGVRITPDGRIGYRSIYATDVCYTGATQAVSGITNSSFVDYSCSYDSYTVKKIITKYFTIEDSYTKVPIIDLSQDKYLLISVTFERDFSYDTLCELTYGKYKNGTLSIFINGFNVYRNKHVSEVIPHALDTDGYLQEGVPFNLSFGGGTQGLYEAIYVDTGDTVNGLLDKFFAGTFDGGIKYIEMYSVPLYVTEIRNEIINNLQSYNLYYPTGGRRVNLKSKF